MVSAMVLAAVVVCHGQILNIPDAPKLNTDSIKRDFDLGPYFGLYKDNYFIVGAPVGYKATKENSDVKFQISISQRLTRATLPWGTYLYLFYTQKCF